MKTKSSQAGFTIVELMISTAIFAMVLLLCAFAILHIGRMYYKGVITNRTQDISRKLANDIQQSIQFGETSAPADFHEWGSTNLTFLGYEVRSRCLGPVRYSYTVEKSLGSAGIEQSPHVLWKDRNTSPGCPPVDITVDNPLDPTTGAASDGEEILGANMRIPEFEIGNNGTLWHATIRIAYADTVDLFTDSAMTECLGTNAGGQFCAISTFTMNARKRL